GGFGQAPFSRVLMQRFGAEPSAIVRNHHFNLGAAKCCGDRDLAANTLARRTTLLRRLNSVIDGIADQVQERIFETLQNPRVRLQVASLNSNIPLPAARLSEIAYHAIEPLARLGEWEHTNAVHLVVKPACSLVKESCIVSDVQTEPVQVLF